MLGISVGGRVARVGWRATGYTRIVLKWGDKPADLDTYVVPSQVQTLSGVPVHWKAELPNGNGEVFSMIPILFLYPLSPRSPAPSLSSTILSRGTELESSQSLFVSNPNLSP